jgi:hypothetical protein
LLTTGFFISSFYLVVSLLCLLYFDSFDVIFYRTFYEAFKEFFYGLVYAIVGKRGMLAAGLISYFIGVLFIVEDLRGGETAVGYYICIGSTLSLPLFVSSMLLLGYFLSGDGFIAFETLLFTDSSSSDSYWSELCIYELSLLCALDGLLDDFRSSV